MKVIIIGPNPADPTRNGGVAKYIEYLKQIPFKENINFLERNFVYTDIIPFSKLGLKTFGRVLATQFIALKLMFLSGKKHCVHLNTTLSRRGGFRIWSILLVCKLKNIHVLTQIHGGRWEVIKGGLFARYIWLSIFRISKIIGCFAGPQYKELIDKIVSEEKLVKLINFVPTVNYRIQKKLPFTFLYLGRLLKEKGVLDILSAMEIVNKEIIDIEYRLLIVGDGELLTHLQNHKVNNISVLGRKQGDELSVILSNAHVLLLPSYSEGFPLVFLESAVHEILPIVTNTSAIAEYFVEDRDYLSVEPRSPKMLAKIMIETLDNHDQTVKMGKSLCEKVGLHFSIASKQVYKQYYDIYKELMCHE